MIHFYQQLVTQATKAVKEAKDLYGIANDLNRIEYLVSRLKSHATCEDIQAARNLDTELIRRYPTINTMLNIANTLKSPASGSEITATQQDLEEVSNLIQDYYGILCDVLLKKKLVSKIEQFIESVD